MPASAAIKMVAPIPTPSPIFMVVESVDAGTALLLELGVLEAWIRVGMMMTV